MSKEDWDKYDDSSEIKENQGYIPKWFSILFGGTIVFGIVYSIWLYASGWTQEKQYREQVKAAQINEPQKTTVVGLTEDGVNPFRGDKEAIAKGQQTFATICAACHKADATGLVGPNLVDNKWLHGNTDKEIFHVIMEGVPADKALQKPPKGPMPPHKASLGAKKVLQVMAWLADKNPSLKPK
ncbi:MAG: cytochrome C [Candidatus Hydrogenedentota bacterium]|nr:MAG: cytochrome C [Candidatus Hydrogenedentota bacterium]